MTAPATPAATVSPPAIAVATVAKSSVQPIAVTVQMPPDDHTFDYVNTGVSGGVGLVAAFIGAYLGYRLTKKANADLKAIEQREKDEVATFALYLKLNAIYTAVKGYRDHFNSEIAKAKADGIPDDHLTAAVQPFANDPAYVTFDSEELFRINRVGGDTLLNNLVSIDEQHNGMIQTFAQYRDRRLALMATFSDVQKVEGKDSIVEFDIEDEEKSKHFNAQMLMLNGLIWSAKKYADALTVAVFNLMIDLQRARSTFTGRSFEMEIPKPDGTTETFEFRPLVLSKKRV